MKPHICTTSKALVLTSGTPTPCCPEGTPVWFSASERYSGNGKHAAEEENNRTEVRSQVRGDIHPYWITNFCSWESLKSVGSRCGGLHCRHPRRQCTPQTLQKPGWPGTLYLMRQTRQHCNSAKHPADALWREVLRELTEIHDVVPTDSTVIHHYVPGPQRHSIPLVENKQTLSTDNIMRWSGSLYRVLPP